MTLAQALRSPQFIILLATNFFCCATHSGPIIHTVSYAISCGIPLIAAVTIYSVEGLAGMGGRIAFGLLGDRFGAKRVLVLGLLAQAFGALGYVFVRELAAFYAVAALFGFIYAGIMPLYAVLARENFPLRMMGTVIGGTAMAGSLGMATGPLAGGLIYDTFASYAWLYIGSWIMGLGAFLIIMTFRPVPAARAARRCRRECASDIASDQRRSLCWNRCDKIHLSGKSPDTSSPFRKNHFALNLRTKTSAINSALQTRGGGRRVTAGETAKPDFKVAGIGDCRQHCRAIEWE